MRISSDLMSQVNAIEDAQCPRCREHSLCPILQAHEQEVRALCIRCDGQYALADLQEGRCVNA